MRIAHEQDLLETITADLPPVGRGLVIAPHPDDEVFGCGGALALLRRQGAALSVVVVTDGAAGGADPDGRLVARREEESRRAAAILGIPEPLFLRLPDRGICYGEPLIDRLAGLIREAGADTVVLPSPTELHPDHQTLALAGAEAVRRLGGGLRALFYEVGFPIPEPNLIIDISAVAQEKDAAMRCFASQLDEQPYAARIAGLNRFRGHAAGAGVASAEAFVTATAAELSAGLPELFPGVLARRRQRGFAVDGGDLPLVSVIIRSMDRPTLDAALASVALQTYPHMEVVVVNALGGAHRDPGGYCGRFPLRLVTGDGPLSRPCAANLGLDAARGDFLIFLDDDDSFYPHHVAALVSRLDNDPEAVAAYAAVQCVDGDGVETVRFADDFDRIQLILDNFMPIHAVLFRRAPLLAGVRFDEHLEVCEDWDFWLQVAEHGEFRFVRHVGAIYNLGNQNGSGVWDDAGRTRAVMTAIYRKWLPRWSDGTVWSLLDHARSRRLMLKAEELLRAGGFAEGGFLQLIEAAIATRHEAAVQQQQMEAQRQQMEAQQQQMEAQRQQIEAQQQQIEAQQQQIENIYASSSWKFSAPLRLAARCARWLPRLFSRPPGR